MDYSQFCTEFLELRSKPVESIQKISSLERDKVSEFAWEVAREVKDQFASRGCPIQTIEGSRVVWDLAYPALEILSSVDPSSQSDTIPWSKCQQSWYVGKPKPGTVMNESLKPLVDKGSYLFGPTLRVCWDTNPQIVGIDSHPAWSILRGFIHAHCRGWLEKTDLESFITDTM
jgi:hypothetical protein